MIYYVQHVLLATQLLRQTSVNRLVCSVRKGGTNMWRVDD